MRRMLATAIALALAGLASTTSAQSVADVSGAANPPLVKATSQLPTNVRPSHYAIEVTPHADKMTFDGQVSIDVQVLESTSSIVLQAVNMTFASSVLAPSDGKRGQGMPAKVSVDAKNQTATFAFDKPLAPECADRPDGGQQHAGRQ